MTVSQIQWLEYEYDWVSLNKKDLLTDLSMIDLNMTMTYYELNMILLFSN